MTTAQPRSEASGPRHKRVRRSRGRVRVNGAWLAYDRVGSGLPVVFVPGSGSDRRMWTQQVKALANHYEVIRYDLRGCGRSGRGPGPFRHAEDLAHLLDAVHVEQAAVIGHMEGAEIALELALDRPDLVRVLVLVSPRLGVLETRLGRTYLREGRPLYVHAPMHTSPIQRRARRKAQRRVFVIQFPNNLRLLPAFWNRATYDRYFPQWSHPPANDRLSEITAPTLIVLGALTNPLPLEEAEVVRAGIHDIQVATVPDVGPAPSVPLEAPEPFNRLVLDFLAARYRPDAPVRDATT